MNAALDALTPEQKQQLRALVRSEPFILFVRTCIAPRLAQAQKYLQVVTNPRDTDMHMKGFIKACTDLIQTCAELAATTPERFYTAPAPEESLLASLLAPETPGSGGEPEPHSVNNNNRNAFPA